MAPPAGAADIVTFAGKNVTLSGHLFLPQGQGPFPAVVALHGCNGLGARSGKLSGRHASWGEHLSSLGFVVLMPDSFGSRGLGQQCGTREREVRPSRQRVEDALAAKAFLQGRPDVKADAVSLLGWSNGGSTVLYAVERKRGGRDGKADFARAVAFYPGCRVPLQRGNWHARLPLMILIGEADDWTPAAPCQELAEAAAGAGETVTIKLYPGAFHDFDAPGLPIRTRKGLAFTADGGGEAHTGTDENGRADALKRVPEFLAR